MHTPYGGQNPVQDFLFQAQLTSKCMWEDFFSEKDNNFSYDLENLKKQISDMSHLSPELKVFFKSRLHLMLDNKSI